MPTLNRRLHVLSLIADFSFGGPATRLLGLAKAIDRSRFDLTLASIKRPDPHIDAATGSLRGEIAAAGFRIVDMAEPYSTTQPSSLKPQNVARAGWVFTRLVWRVNRLIRRLRVDVLDCHLLIANLAGAFAGRLAGTPIATTLYYAPGWTPLLPHLLERLALAASTAVVTDSRARRDDIRKAMFRPHPRVCVIPNPIFTPRSQKRVTEMRGVLGLPVDPKIRIIGHVGRLIPSKGCGTTVRAARLVLDQEPDVAFLLVGYDETGGSYRRRLEHEAAELGVAERVRILGYPGPIGDVWEVIDVHTHPSLLESFPSVILEGMSLGKPAVVSSVGGVPELVEDGTTGLLVPPGDAAALAQALVCLLRHPDIARRLGANAHRLYTEQYRPEIVGRQFEQLFSGLAARRREAQRAAPT